MVRKPTEVMPISDPAWIPLAKAFLPFLSRKPKTWPEMKAWARKKKLTQETLRNTVAWCETADLAVCSYRKKEVVWGTVDGWEEDLSCLERGEPQS